VANAPWAHLLPTTGIAIPVDFGPEQIRDRLTS